MPEFLNGVEQGGGLTTVADVTVSGGAVTTLSSGTISLESNKWYKVRAHGASATSTGTIGIYVNEDHTASNYTTRFVQTNGFGNEALSTPMSGTVDTVGDRFSCDLSLMWDGTQVRYMGCWASSDRAAGKTAFGDTLYLEGTAVTSISVHSTTASGLANDTRLIITEAY